jgi:hypothetical protein
MGHCKAGGVGLWRLFRKAKWENKKGSRWLPFLFVGEAYFFAIPYFWRNFSTRPAVSTIFCLPV